MYKNKNSVLFMAGPPPPPPSLPSDLLKPKDPLIEAKRRKTASGNQAPQSETKKDNISEKLEKLGIDLKLIINFSDIDKNIILNPSQFKKIDKAHGDEKNRLINELKEKIIETARRYEEVEQKKQKSNNSDKPNTSNIKSLIVPNAPIFQGVPPPPPKSGMEVPLSPPIEGLNSAKTQNDSTKLQQKKPLVQPMAPKGLDPDELKKQIAASAARRSGSPDSGEYGSNPSGPVTSQNNSTTSLRAFFPPKQTEHILLPPTGKPLPSLPGQTPSKKGPLPPLPGSNLQSLLKIDDIDPSWKDKQ